MQARHYVSASPNVSLTRSDCEPDSHFAKRQRTPRRSRWTCSWPPTRCSVERTWTRSCWATPAPMRRACIMVTTPERPPISDPSHLRPGTSREVAVDVSSGHGPRGETCLGRRSGSAARCQGLHPRCCSLRAWRRLATRGVFNDATARCYDGPASSRRCRQYRG